MIADNPFFTASSLPLQFPRFDLIRDEHYRSAFERGMAEQLAEIAVITANPEAPSLANTLLALERSGQLLERVSAVFFALSSAHTNTTIQALETELAPRLAEHSDSILLNAALFARIEALYQRRANLDLDPESLRLVEITHRDFVRAGAALSAADKARLRILNTQLAELDTTFSHNVLNEVNAKAVVVDTREELDGLSEMQIQAAAAAAQARALPGKYLLPLLNTSSQPALAALHDRALRQRIMEVSLARNSDGEFDNRPIMSAIARLRGERAQLLGYPHHAAYVLARQMAAGVEAVNQRLADLTPRAVANAHRELADLQACADSEGAAFELRAWDWAYYTAKVRKQRYEFDDTQIRPYMELHNVLSKGLFYAAGQLYGLTFSERPDLPVYHADVKVFEVNEADGKLLGYFIFDPWARPSKRGGAWMNAYVSQSRLLGTQAVVGNHLNVMKPPAGEPALLSFEEVATLFHEFGHALHALFSQVTYPLFSGTHVPRDFVEYPSQLNEMWAIWPDVLRNYARHWQHGNPMPVHLLDKVLVSRQFNQGFATSEYLMCCIIDMAIHQLAPAAVPAAEELLQFEHKALAAAGAQLDVLPPRYRLPYFSHIAGGYSAGYYSYIWSEVLDADTVEWFRENGGMTRANGQHLRDTLLSRGGSADAMHLFRTFRGAEPSVDALLERRGLK